MASRKKSGYGKLQLLFQLIAVLLLSALLVGILATEISRTADALQYEEAALTTVSLSLDKVGYVFYDATVVESVDRGPIDYRVADGAAVTAGDTLAVVYADGAGAGTRARASEIIAEIERLQALDGVTPPNYHAAYAKLMEVLSAGGTQSGAIPMATVADALALFAAQGESADARAAKIAALRAEFEELIKNDREASNTAAAPAAGIFRRGTDGFEENMSLAVTDTLTVGALAALLASPQDRSAAIGAIVLPDAWRLAIAVTADEAAGLAVGTAYQTRFARTGEMRALQLVRIGAPDAEGNCLLILAGTGMPPADFERRQPISLCYGTRTGVAVPMAALAERDGGYGVYVYENGRAAWRTVEPAYFENGYLLVSADAPAGALAAGEKILVTLRRIYEGKLL